MYRFRVPEIFLGCFLTVAVFAAGMLFQGVEQSSRPAQAIEKQEAASQGHKADNPDAELTGSTWLTKDAAGFFTFGLVVIGIGQVVMFFFQLRYMRRGMNDATIAAEAAQGSSETAKEQIALTRMGIVDLERAYLAVGPTNIRRMIVTQLGLEDAPSAAWETNVSIHVHNTGRTGATIVKLYGEFSQTSPEGDIPIYENGDWTETDLSVGADKETDLPLRFKSDWTEPQFFWGFVEYKDIFKITHVSRFCTFIHPSMDIQPGKYEMAGSPGWRECD
jgi:hypothetical protein